VKEYVMATTTGARRGQPMVFKQPTDLQQVMVNADGLDFRHVWDHVESRIAAVTGIPSVLAGLAVGMANANYATVDAMLEYLTKTVLMAAWRIDGERWTMGLAADFGLGPDEWIGYDWLGLAALSDDETERVARIVSMWSSSMIDLATAAKMADLPEVPDYLAGVRYVDLQMNGTPPDPATIPAAAQGAPPLLVGDKNAIVAIMQAVGQGTLQADAAVAFLVNVMKIPEDQAEAIIGAAPIIGALPPPEAPKALPAIEDFGRRRLGERPSRPAEPPMTIDWDVILSRARSKPRLR
jgi:hypothetical protein